MNILQLCGLSAAHLSAPIKIIVIAIAIAVSIIITELFIISSTGGCNHECRHESPAAVSISMRKKRLDCNLRLFQAGKRVAKGGGFKRGVFSPLISTSNTLCTRNTYASRNGWGCYLQGVKCQLNA